jgi:hypothetical protein
LDLASRTGRRAGSFAALGNAGTEGFSMTFAIIWAVVLAALLAVYGYHDECGKIEDNPSVLFLAFWPVILAFACVVGPFIGAYWLGRWVRTGKVKK